VKEQQKEIDALKSELKEQKALIQKVSAQIEVTKRAPQVGQQSLKPVGVGAASQPWTAAGKQSGLLTHIAAINVSLCTRMNC